MISTFVASLLLFFSILDAPVIARLSIAPPPRPPMQTTETGLVMLDVDIDPTGKPSGIEPVQGMTPFVEPSVQAVRQWSFQPLKKGQISSPATVVMLYRSRTALPDRAFAVELPAGVPERDRPPQASMIIDPGYPIQSVAEGVVILQMDVDSRGGIQRTDVIQDVPSLTWAATHAASQWKFRPAMHGGKPVSGTVIAAISFLRPVL